MTHCFYLFDVFFKVYLNFNFSFGEVKKGEG